MPISGSGKERGWEVRTPQQVACLWFPDFEVGLELRRCPQFRGEPVALIGSGEGTAETVVRACSVRVRAAGVRAGNPAVLLSQRCPRAVVLPYDLPYYERRYAEVLLALDAVSPAIEPRPFDACFLDLDGIPGLDPLDPTPLAAAVRAVLPEGLVPRIGVASGKFVAWVAARTATPVRPILVADEERALFLNRAPSTLLPAEPELLQVFQRLGLRTLGDVARLPRRAMLARFGRPGERLHRLASGEDREPFQAMALSPVIREEITFPMTAPSVADFYLALERLVRRTFRRAERRGRAVRQVRVQARLESGEVWERRLTLRRPLETPERVLAELRRRLEPGGGSHRPNGAFTELALEITSLAGSIEAQPALALDEREHRLEQLLAELEQLRARLGTPSVYRIVEREPWSRLPERRYALVNFEP